MNTTDALRKAATYLVQMSRQGRWTDERRVECEELAAGLEALAAAEQGPCDMGPICLGCEPRNADGSCPARPAPQGQAPAGCSVCGCGCTSPKTGEQP